MREWLVHRPTEVNIAKHSSHFIKIYYTILKEYEKYPETKGIRLFTLLPHKHGFAQSHITICNTGLETTLKYIAKKIKVANGTVDPALEMNDFTNNRDAYWRKLFNISKYETAQKKFGYTILTDGKSIVVRMRKPKSTTEPRLLCCTKKVKKGGNTENTAYTRETYDNFIGIDPGVRALITSYDTNNRTIQVSIREYRHESKMIYACKKRERWYKRWEHYEDGKQSLPSRPVKPV